MKLVLKDADIEIDGVNLSNHANSVTLEDSADEVDITGFQSDYKEFDQGLKDATITITFISDFEAGKVDATLYPLYSGGDTFDVVVKPTDDAVSATNPAYVMHGRMYTYNPIAGGVGDASTTDVTFRNASQLGIVKQTVAS